MGCSLGVPGDAESGQQKDSSDYQQYFPKYTRPAAIPFPTDNLFTEERAQLGKTLFFDPRLSGSNWISCATCHNPALSWGDGLPKAIGHGMTELTRRTPAIWNLAWATSLFWDGRTASLEEQALGPIAAQAEMNLSLDKMVAKLKGIPQYGPLFASAYANEPISEKTVAKALATFERTVISGKAPFDRWMEGDESAVSAAAKQGFVLFNTKANCVACHSGWRLTDDSFHDVGLAGEDRGRGTQLEGIEEAQFTFKTPTLRNVERRAPYMHDGATPTLEAVIDLYNRGGDVRRPSLSPQIKPLHLTAKEEQDLLAFLHTLTSVDAPVTVPTLPQ
ncbi:MAG: c-type cytochrome [Deltaproteobacteria bacterium]|nr:c-type cytochrome [Deltaproteobacteria bacterium]